MTQDIRDQIARIIDPHSFIDYSGDDEMVGEIVRQSREDALRKADRIAALFNYPTGYALSEAKS